ncbi:transporter substrate-binding domain-containing protein [Coriobacterium glomerans]|nr:transporter substrate-binding domain-containing protein [Coriobacterium glomerans]
MSVSRRQFIEMFGMAAIGVAAAGSLVGCGEDSGSGSSKIEAIKSRGKLKAGVKKDVPGYGYLDPASGKYEGMEIDLCYQVAASVLEVSYEEAKQKDLVEFKDVTPKTRGPLIDNDNLDIICATYTITDTRKESYDFSEPYRTDYVGMMVKKSSGMEDLDDLDGKVIGVSQGSDTKAAITKMLADQKADAKPTYQEFPDYPSLKSALDAGNVDVFAMDRSTLKNYMDDSVELLREDIKFGPQEYGIASKKGSDLSPVVAKTVKDLKSDGWLDKEAETWKLI